MCAQFVVIIFRAGCAKKCNLNANWLSHKYTCMHLPMLVISTCVGSYCQWTSHAKYLTTYDAQNMSAGNLSPIYWEEVK